MKLLQFNLRLGIFNTISMFCVFALIGFLYQTRMGYELLTPPPLPEQIPAPEAREGIVPKPCVGFHGSLTGWGLTSDQCPDHHAFFATTDGSGDRKEGPGEFVPLTGICCPLPAKDILTDRHTYSETTRCPDQHVATGGAGSCSQNCTMRCTQINTKRYRLGPETMSYYVKFSDAGRTFGQGAAERVYWEHLPEGIRYGVLRMDHQSWWGDGCLGVPLGSMLVAKTKKRCDGYFYRRLEYLDGVPVKMVPDCHVLSDPYATEPECLDASRADEAKPAVVKR